jgi:hypothetical protein
MLVGTCSSFQSVTLSTTCVTEAESQALMSQLTIVNKYFTLFFDPVAYQKSSFIRGKKTLDYVVKLD